jgi:hypothetical protein
MALFRNIPVLAILLLAQCIYAQPKKPGPLRPAKVRLNNLDRLSRMPPAQRQRALEKLSPERRAQVEDRLEKYNQLPQAQKDRLRAQTETFQNLPPERQEAVRRMFRRYNNLPEDRRQPVRDELRQLRGMPESERNARMNSQEFWNKYSPGERQILENLTKLVPED